MNQAILKTMPRPPWYGHAETEGDTETLILEKTLRARPWSIIVHDDPVSLMSYVTHVFQKVFGYSRERAERHMMEVHNNGRSMVWTGPREKAEIFAGKLQSFHLRTTLEQSTE
jgi:ATP-dependent Clp protease adaptor protein ClpS